MTARPPLTRRLLAELLGSAFLAAVVVGSGIAAQRLSPGDTGLQLFENAAATAAGLFAIILMFGPVSGGHFNPVVSFVDARSAGSAGATRWPTSPPKSQDAFWRDHRQRDVRARRCQRLDPPPRHPRAPIPRGHRHCRAAARDLLARPHAPAHAAPAAVGAYIGAAYFFTSSTSFANPAITVGRMFSDTFAGIAPASVPGFVVAQTLGGCLAMSCDRHSLPARHGGRSRRRDRASCTAGDARGRRGRRRTSVSTALFVCLHNAGRSQMSQALFERGAEGRHTALSAGTTPADAGPPRGRRGNARARHRPIRPKATAAHPRTGPTRRYRGHDGLRRRSAPTSPASATSIGTSPTPRAVRSRRFGRSGMTSANACAH